MSGYIGNVPVPQATQTRETFTATASQTSFATAGYNPGYIDVFLNGVKLVDGTDYTATNGSDVVLSTGAAASDILEVVAYSTFEVANQAFTGDFSVDSPTFVVDSTNNRVGIGTASPATSPVGFNKTLLTLDDDAGSPSFVMRQSTGNRLEMGLSASGGWLGTSDNYVMRFATNNTERLRIDSSGNLLVGKTADTYSVAGASIRANPTGVLSGATVTRDGANVVSLNRLTSDGDILTFSKDTTTVGSISSHGGGVDLGIGSGDVGLRFQGSSDAMFPFNTVSNSGRDNAIDLGLSDNRFRNLYLSGGVYLGGTGAANYLDDYEEGTFTPTLNASSSNPTVGYSDQIGAYTKVGRLVTVDIYLITSSVSGGSGEILIGGLPFAVSSSSSLNKGTGAIIGFRVNTEAESVVIAVGSSSNLRILSRSDTSTSGVWGNQLIGDWSAAATVGIRTSISYITDA